jgi:hypothetical protein
MVWPSPEAATLTVFPSGSFLELPIRPQSAADAGFAVARPRSDASSVATTALEDGLWERRTEADPEQSLTTIVNVADGGLVRLDAIGMAVGTRAEDRYSLREGDPASARCVSRRIVRMERPGWRIRIEVEVTCICNASSYFLQTTFEAFENGASIFRREWDAEFARDAA